MTVHHPYYPPDLYLPEYVPPAMSPGTLCACMGAFSFLAAFAGWAGMGVGMGVWERGGMRGRERERAVGSWRRVKGGWYALCAAMHICFEGYWLLHRGSIAARTDPFAEAWKEYALSDSRYLAQDPFVVAIEGLTVFFAGPLALATYVSLQQRRAHSAALELMMSLAHLYAATLYFLTSAVDGHRHVRPELRYAVVYFFVLNAAWIVVPAVLGYRAFRRIRIAAERARRAESEKEE